MLIQSGAKASQYGHTVKNFCVTLYIEIHAHSYMSRVPSLQSCRHQTDNNVQLQGASSPLCLSETTVIIL